MRFQLPPRGALVAVASMMALPLGAQDRSEPPDERRLSGKVLGYGTQSRPHLIKNFSDSRFDVMVNRKKRVYEIQIEDRIYAVETGRWKPEVGAELPIVRIQKDKLTVLDGAKERRLSVVGVRVEE